MGTYAAPDFTTATIAMTASTPRGKSKATRSPRPTPASSSTAANRPDASASSRYVGDVEEQVEPCGGGERRDRCHLKPAEFDLGAGVVLECQRDLEQRVVRHRTHGVQL